MKCKVMVKQIVRSKGSSTGEWWSWELWADNFTVVGKVRPNTTRAASRRSAMRAARRLGLDVLKV